MLAALLCAVVGAAPTPLTRVVSSDGGLRLAPQPALNWTAAACPESGALHVMTDDQHQTIGGFGASMTESSAINLNSLPAAKQEALLGDIFGPSGARFSAMKATMLSNDFAAAAPWSTYDDQTGDTALAKFSIERDLRQNGSLTLIKRAIAAGFVGTIQAYMDWPPDWMLSGPPDANATVPKATVDPKMYDVLASYFAKYVEAYKEHGVVIDFLECFNEPTDSYVMMSAEQLALFLGRHIGPKFDALGLRPRTRLTYGGQCARATAHQFVTAVMADPDAAKYMDLIAYHGYDCQLADYDNPASQCNDTRQNYHLIRELGEAYGKEMWMTEICYAYYPLGGDDEYGCTHADALPQCDEYPRDPKLAPPLPRTDFADGATWGHRLVRELQAGVSGWIYWNLALDTRGGPYNLSPQHGDPVENLQHGVVIVDAARGTYLLTGVYYFLAHFARFVRPGAVRLGVEERSLPASVDTVAFLDSQDEPQADPTAAVRATSGAAGGATIQLVNTDRQQEQRVAVCTASAGQSYVTQVTLPPASITTGQWSAEF